MYIVTVSTCANLKVRVQKQKNIIQKQELDAHVALIKVFSKWQTLFAVHCAST